MLLVGGATETDSRVVKIDPRTFKATEIVRLPDDPAQFFHASVAAQVDNEIWLGSARATASPSIRSHRRTDPRIEITLTRRGIPANCVIFKCVHLF